MVNIDAGQCNQESGQYQAGQELHARFEMRCGDDEQHGGKQFHQGVT
jgi:hypothetical protein